MFKISTYLMLALILVGFSGENIPVQAASDAPQINLSAIEKHQAHFLAIKILTEAYGRIGQPVTFKFLAPIRALKYANEGITDGDVARIAGTEKVFTNLLAVPTPMFTFRGRVYTKTISKEIEHWDDLKGFKVGIIRGIRYSEIGSKDLNQYFANDITQLFRMLVEGNVDVVVSTNLSGRAELVTNFPNEGIYQIGKPVHEAALYHFVHRKHKNLIPALDVELRKMDAEGLLKKYYETALKDVYVQ